MSNDERILTLAPPTPDRVWRYGDAPSQFAHFFLPKSPAVRPPLLVALHGGYWRARYGLEYLGHLCRALADEGWAVCSVEYRRVGEPGGGWPGCVDDIGLALRRLVDDGWTERVDADRTVLLGHSAGGHLALCAARRWGMSGGETTSLHVSGVVALAPLTDLRSAREAALSSGAVDELLEASTHDESEVSRLIQEASPAEWSQTPGPVALVHGRKDDCVPWAMSEAYARRPGTRLWTSDEAGHYECVDPSSPEFVQVRDALAWVAGGGSR